MQIVIANPPDVLDNGLHSILFPSRCDWVGDTHSFSYYPYELAYLSTFLKREMPDDSIVMLDGNDFGLDADQYYQLIRAHHPDLLITECGHLTYGTMTRLRERLGVRGILCGPIATAFPARAIKDGWEPVPGEYEYWVLAKLRDLRGMPDRVDLDVLPWPEDQDIYRIRYQEESGPVSGMVQVYPTRGCPLSCPYCTTGLYYGGYPHKNNHRCRDIDDVCDELEYLADRYGNLYRGAMFNEETHNANMPWLRSFASRLIERGLNRYVYEAMCGYWGWTQEDIGLLSIAGYRQLRLGLESLSPEVGKAINKRIIPGRFTALLEWMRAAGIDAYVTSMIGTLGSTKEGDLQTLETLHDLKARGLVKTVQFSISTPNPGTAFYRTCKENGWLLTEDWNSAHWHSGVISYPHYSADEIRQVFEQYYTLRKSQ